MRLSHLFHLLMIRMFAWLVRRSGATLRDLMKRMGHDSVRAATIYQHRTAEADHKIANAMNGKIAEVLPTQASGR
ncbi:hypothetical protein ACFY05_41400 [Microtetraspora fusca]|uniref:Tyr recombinase domain-containing protein n=1 Tax=Microtetraspora fusca TaxID=1997 RepID=A0ABW6VK06_MICFU